MERNSSQKRAIAHLSGPMLVLAGPGSGKTSVIVERTEYLIEKAKVPASSILVVTFSKAAAIEMQERFQKRTKEKYKGVTFGTFHAIFFWILRKAYGFGRENIISEEDKLKFLRKEMEKYSEELLEDGDALDEIAREISTVKGNGIDLQHYYSTSCPDEVFREIYSGYNMACREQRLLDFDDMIVYCYELLSQREDIRRMWQQKFQYILVDEFQDINQMQYKTLQLLAEPKRNLFIVGDDDQSIYHFRGARPEIMLNFRKDYPEAKQVLLNVNYRCSGNILSGAMRLIGNNKKRYKKELATPNVSGDKIKILHVDDPKDEYRYLIHELRSFEEAGEKLEDTAILLRTNIEAEGLIGALLSFEIPFFMKEHLPNLFEHWIAKDLLAYLELAAGGMDRANFLRIMNHPKRYICRDAVKEKNVSFASLLAFYSKKDWMCDRILLLETHLRILAKLKPYAAINFIRKGIGYEEYLQEYALYRKIKTEDLLEILDRIQESTKELQTLEEWKQYIQNYSEKLKEQDQNQKEKRTGVTISTLHGSKGLEFKRVYILNVNEGNIPYRKAVLESALEEERRLFYVGMTRAKKELILCVLKKQYDKEKNVSRFIGEIKENMMVHHNHPESPT